MDRGHGPHRVRAEGLTPEVIAARLKRYINALGRLGTAERVEHIQWIDNKVIADTKLDDVTKRDMLVDRAVLVGGYRVIKQLAEESVGRREKLRRARPQWTKRQRADR